MRAFANQLREDLRGKGIGVTLIAPSEVESPRERIPRSVVLLGGAVAPELVGRATADAIERDRNEVIVPRQAEIVVKLTPRSIFDWLVRRTGWRRPA
jgi:short-subunit dehydrogenase